MNNIDASKVEFNGGTLEDELSAILIRQKALTEMFELQALELAELRSQIAQVNKNNQQLSQALCMVSEGKRFMMDSPSEMREVKRAS